jgi:hypothetical protein
MITYKQYFHQNKEKTAKKKFDEVYAKLEEEKESNTIGYYKLAKKSKNPFNWRAFSLL